MEETTYVSPDGVEQPVSTPIEAYRLKNRGWKPKQVTERPPAPVNEPTDIRSAKPSPKKTKQPTKPAA